MSCRSKKGPTAQRGDAAEDILAMLNSGESVHKVPLTLEGGVARVMKKLLDQARLSYTIRSCHLIEACPIF